MNLTLLAGLCFVQEPRALVLSELAAGGGHKSRRHLRKANIYIMKQDLSLSK